MARARNARLGFLAVLLLAAWLAAPSARAGWIEEHDGQTILHVKLWYLPDPSFTDTATRADVAAVREFVKRFPKIFAEKYRDKYKANPQKYGKHNWDNVVVRLRQVSGIRVEGVETTLLSIAGKMSPDVIYVHFRQSATYIRPGSLYPLDKAADGYVTGMSKAETDFRIHPKIWPVIRRKGPDGEKHVWAIPWGGALGKVVWYRKDLFDEAGIPYPKNDWTWDDFYDICKKLTDPERGIWGARFGTGKHESWYWISFLWSAGADVMTYDEPTDTWTAVFNTPEAAIALDFYTQLSTEKWIDKRGREREGYAYKDTDAGVKWERGEIGMYFQYIDEKLFAQLNPDVTGMVPVPIGPTGVRGAELNSRMMGLYADIKEPAIRDAAWEYMRFYDCKDAMRIKTRVMVEGGLGRFVNPRYLRMFGYEELIRLAPKGWSEIFKIAIETGMPEPYGKDSNYAYYIMTDPIQEADLLARRGELAEGAVADGDLVKLLRELRPAEAAYGEMLGVVPSQERRAEIIRQLESGAVEPSAVRGELEGLIALRLRLDRCRALLDRGVAKANDEMLGVVPPHIRTWRRITAAVALMAIMVVFVLVFRRVVRAFTPPPVAGQKAPGWQFRRYKVAYLLLLPAVFTIFFWQYVPLLRGSVMAFMDYKIMGGSSWVWLDNFGDILWSPYWWSAIWISLRYSFLVGSLTSLPPVILAILRQEVPRGKLLFRTLFYLPAVITGLVVILLWKSFYEAGERGMLNGILLSIPSVFFLLAGLVLLGVAGTFARRLFYHRSTLAASLFVAAGLLVFYTCVMVAWPVFRQKPVAQFAVRLAEPFYTLGLFLFAGMAFFVARFTVRLARSGNGRIAALFGGGGFVVFCAFLFLAYPNFLNVLPGWLGFLKYPFMTLSQPRRWLQSKDTALLCCVLPMVWAGMGPGCLIYLAALKGIPEDFYEAADVDGATFVDKVLFVIFPILKPLLIINFVGVFIGSWRSTANILAMTGGGFANGTEVSGLHIFFKAFIFLKFGPATAMAWTLGFLLIGFTVHQLTILSRLEFRTTGGDDKK